MAGTHIRHGRKQSSHHDRMATTLISDQVGTHPSITSEWPCTHIWPCKTTSYNRLRKALSPIPSIPGNSPGSSIPRMAVALIYDHVGTNPTVISEWLSTHNCHERNQSSNHERMAQPLHLTYSLECPSTYIWPTCQNGMHSHMIL